MKPRWISIFLLLSSLLTAPKLYASAAKFDYSGELEDAGLPAHGRYDLRFTLFDTPTLNGVVGSPVQLDNVLVENGTFFVTLDFGNVFDGSDRWLEIEVRASVSANPLPFTTLTPRVQIAPIPYAISAKSLSGDLPASKITGTIDPEKLPASVPRLDGNPVFTGTVSFNTALNIPPFSVAQPARVNNLNTEFLDGFRAESFWNLLGNTATDPNLNFLGTADNVPLTLRVNNLTAWRILPDQTLRTDPGSAPIEPPASPNLAGGFSGNLISSDARGATIAGGGSLYDHVFHSFDSGRNEIGQAGDFSFIGSGSANYLKGPHNAIVSGHYNRLIDANYSFIGSGAGNLIVAPVDAGAIVAGSGNSLSIRADAAFIGGGINNTASNTAAFIGAGAVNLAGGEYSMVVGGSNNLATGAAASVLGGADNQALGDHSLAAGRGAQAAHDRTFVWNSGVQNEQFTSTAPNQFLIRANGNVGINLNNPSEALEVAGNIKADHFIGNGSMLTGVIGTPGPAGAAGTVWRSGAGVPEDSLGSEGDYYLNVSNGDIFKRGIVGYIPQGNIAGPIGLTGPAGAPGPTGETGSPGPTGPQGEAGPPGATGPIGLQGPPGSAGPAGAAGTVWRSGAGVPEDSLGSEGDYYLNVSSGDIFKRGIVAYTVQGNIAGPIGLTGPAGAPGPTGDTGPTGPQGQTGSPGPTGATGAIGPQGLPGSADAWSRTGNSGTTAANFLGTSDNQPLELRVNNATALRLQPSTSGNPAPTANLVGGAANNSISASAYGSVIAGGGNVNGSANVISAQLSFIGGGDNNLIAGGSEHSSIVGGNGNNIAGSSHHGAIVGGQNNIIGASAPNSFLGGGTANLVNGGTSVLGGGSGNRLLGTSGAILGGENNYLATTSQYGVIGGGYFNTNAAPMSGTIGGGERNLVITNYGTIPGGYGATVRSKGQMAYANGIFSTNGDAQASLYVLRTITANTAGQTEFVASPDLTGRMQMPPNSVWTFDIIVVAASNNGLSAGYQIKGVARCDAFGVVTLLPPAIPATVLYEDAGAAAWDVNIAGDSSGNKTLKLLATGATGININWVANVRTVELIR